MKKTLIFAAIIFILLSCFIENKNPRTLTKEAFDSKSVVLRRNLAENFSISQYIYIPSKGNTLTVNWSGESSSMPDVYYTTSSTFEVDDTKKLNKDVDNKRYTLTVSGNNAYTLFYQNEKGENEIINKIYSIEDTSMISVTHSECLNKNLGKYIVTVNSDLLTDLSRLNVVFDENGRDVPFDRIGETNVYQLNQDINWSISLTLELYEKNYEINYLFQKTMNVDTTEVSIPKTLYETSTSIKFISTCSFTINSVAIGETVIACNQQQTDPAIEYTCTFPAIGTTIVNGNYDFYLNNFKAGEVYYSKPLSNSLPFSFQALNCPGTSCIIKIGIPGFHVGSITLIAVQKNNDSEIQYGEGTSNLLTIKNNRIVMAISLEETDSLKITKLQTEDSSAESFSSTYSPQNQLTLVDDYFFIPESQTTIDIKILAGSNVNLSDGSIKVKIDGVEKEYTTEDKTIICKNVPVPSTQKILVEVGPEGNFNSLDVYISKFRMELVSKSRTFVREIL